jgi:hypothetical protein
LPVEILGKETVHLFRVIHGLNENIILGADFINKHLLVYDTKFKQVKWRKDNAWSVSSVKMTHETVIPEYSLKLVKVKMENGTEKTEQVVAEIMCAAEPYLVRGPGLVNIDASGCSLIEVFNAGPEPVTLERGQGISQADNIEGQSLFPFEADQVNQIAEQQLKLICKSAVIVRPNFYQMCNHEVPIKYRERYRTLLAKHRNNFSLSKSDLGFCDTVLHKLFMKTEEPIYVKQFKIPKAHQNYLQDQVREWLKLAIIQPTRSHYNSPVFLVQKKDGTH